MSLVKDLFTENPMMIEITRFRRKFIGGRGNSVNAVLFAMSAIIYVGIVGLVWSFRDSANPIIIIFLQTGLFTLLAPAMLHGAIAGERERRSWDFLLVAPVTHAQIVCGKFMGAAAAIVPCTAAFLFPIAIGVAFYEPYRFGVAGPLENTGVNIWNLFLAELISVTWAFCICAMTIFFSARCRRGFVALGTVLAFLIAGLIVWPILVTTAGGYAIEGNLLNFFHPFWSLAQIEMASNRSIEDQLWSRLYGLPQVLVYIFMTVVFLGWTVQTLRFADNEVKFLPKKHDA